MNNRFDNVQKICICDFSDNMYKEKLNIELSEAETQSIISMFGSTTPKNEAVSGTLLYSLVLINFENNIFQRLLVDSRYTVYTDIDHSYERTEKNVAILKQIETAHNLKEELSNRIPSGNYFALMSFADHGILYEVTDNYFIEGITLDISKDKCFELKNILSECLLSKTTESIKNPKYIMEIYTSGGGIVTTLFINDQSVFFADSGYLIKSTSLKDYLNNLLVFNDVK